MEVRRTGYKFEEFDRVLQIEWTLGNTCNYNCSYCLPVLHDNSFPWIDLDESIKFYGNCDYSKYLKRLIS